MKSPTPSRPQKNGVNSSLHLLCFAALSVQAEETSVTPQPPDILLGRCLMMCKTPNFSGPKNLCRCRAEQRSADDPC